MNREYIVILGALVVGLSVGFAAVLLLPPGEKTGECGKIEKGINQNKSFNGSVACYPPGVLKVNLSEKVEENTEVQCVCRRSLNGEEQFFTITRSK